MESAQTFDRRDLTVAEATDNFENRIELMNRSRSHLCLRQRWGTLFVELALPETPVAVRTSSMHSAERESDDSLDHDIHARTRGTSETLTSS